MEDIITRLRKVKDEKKVELYKTFTKHCHDIQAEREMILKLLCSTSSGVEVANSKKRKSPETALLIEKLSPEQKRFSTEFEQFLAQEGLHWDATRLKKEQLLDLLAKRSVSGYSMKNLKGQMIDALKSSFKSVNDDQSASLKSLCSTSESPAKGEPETDMQSVTAGSTISKTPGRKGSLMSEFRSLVNGNGSQSQSNDEWVRKEFESRQSRHRDSQIRRSIVEVKVEKEGEHVSTPDSSVDDSNTTSQTTHNTSTWTEVASPKFETANGLQKISENEIEVQVQSVTAAIDSVSIDSSKTDKKLPNPTAPTTNIKPIIVCNYDSMILF